MGGARVKKKQFAISNETPRSEEDKDIIIDVYWLMTGIYLVPGTTFFWVRLVLLTTTTGIIGRCYHLFVVVRST